MSRRLSVPAPLRHQLAPLRPQNGSEITAEERAVRLAMLREEFAEHAQYIDQWVIAMFDSDHKTMQEVQQQITRCKELLDEMTEPPWHPAIYNQPVETPHGIRHQIWLGGKPRLVGLVEGLNATDFEPGDEVFLNNDLNLVVCRSPTGMPRVGETARFIRWTDDRRMVLKVREEEVITDPSAGLNEMALEEGDLVRWDKSCWMAFEHIEQPEDSRYVIEDTPDLTPDDVGGQRHNLSLLLEALTATLVDPEKAALYRLGSRQSVLLRGAPGTGKTLMSRVAAAEIRRRSGKECRFAVVKPAEWENMYVGETQANIRRCFENLVSDDCFTVLFLDEVESVGRIRGSSIGAHNDKFLAALLAEIDGFTERSGVAIVAATNRKDLIDPALLERLSDIEIHVGRPDMHGAREIFGVHLPSDLPFSPNGKAAARTREEVIDRAVSLLYLPNADNELCTIRFRSGQTRTVHARDLASGRLFEQICRTAARAAWRRDVAGGEPGVTTADIEVAVSEAIERLSTSLSPVNARSYLDDLPQDVDVVAVEPVQRRVKTTARYLTSD